MARGEPPGCWVSPTLLETVRQEARGKDGGLRARLERAARTVAVLRGLGYAGAYLGGTHDADHVAWIIRRARELGTRWEELAGELRYGLDGGFYLYGQAAARTGVALPAGVVRPEPVPGLTRLAVPTDEETAWRRWIARALDGLGRIFPVTPQHAAPAGAGRIGRLGRPAPSRRPRGRACRARGQGAALRLSGVRQLRARAPRIRVSGDVPQAPPERPVWRHASRSVRGRRPAMRLGRCARPSSGRRTHPGPPHSGPAAQADAPGYELVDQLSARPRQPAPPVSLRGQAGMRAADGRRRYCRTRAAAKSARPMASNSGRG